MSTKLYALLVCVMTFCTGMAVPAAVEEHGGSIIKTYELAPEESPQLLIEEPFERDGFLYPCHLRCQPAGCAVDCDGKTVALKQARAPHSLFFCAHF